MSDSPKSRARRRALIAALVVLFMLSSFALYRFLEIGPVIDFAVWLHAPSGSVDCGHAKNSWNESVPSVRQVTDCAVAAAKASRPFFVAFTAPGTDDAHYWAIIRYPDGHAIELLFARGMVEKRNQLLRHDCDVPLRLEIDNRYDPPQLHCAPWPPPNLTQGMIFF